MKKLSLSSIEKALNEAGREALNIILNSSADNEEWLRSNNLYHCRVIKEEVIKPNTVRCYWLIFPRYCNDRIIDDFFIAEYTAHKEQDINYTYDSKEYHKYRYTYARLKQIDKAMSYKFAEFHELVEPLADVDVEIAEFKKSMDLYGLNIDLPVIKYEKQNLKSDYYPDVLFAHMLYRLCVLKENIDKKTN